MLHEFECTCRSGMEGCWVAGLLFGEKDGTAGADCWRRPEATLISLRLGAIGLDPERVRLHRRSRCTAGYTKRHFTRQDFSLLAFAIAVVHFYTLLENSVYDDGRQHSCMLLAQSSDALANNICPIQLDRLVGLAMLVLASTVFLYYTIWTLLMVHSI